MKCKEIKYDLPLYFDGVLTPQERAAIDSHLHRCPLCRQKLDDFRDLQSVLHRFEAPVPAGVLDSIRTLAAAELRPEVPFHGFRLIEGSSRGIRGWLVPYTVGGFASVIFGIILLSVILMGPPESAVARLASMSERTQESEILVASSEQTPIEYANSRLSIAAESPSVNPRGALVALTRSLVRGEMHEDEVVVVADVFGNGLARISEVVEPSRDRTAVEELQKALQSDPAYAPFVPAEIDQRSNTVRVVLKIQSVNVYTRSGSTSQ